MSILLDDLSPATLEILAELIERRLEDSDSYPAPVTWHQAQARRNAERELSQVLREAAIVWIPAAEGLASGASPALH